MKRKIEITMEGEWKLPVIETSKNEKYAIIYQSYYDEWHFKINSVFFIEYYF